MEKLLIIDGNSIINRAFYGIKLLTNKHGLFTNGIYGFLKIMFKHLEEIKPDYICVAFDLKAPTFRHKMYSEYKAQRKGMPPELKMQMPVMKEVLSAMNISIIEKEGFEADDIIGTVSRICDEKKIECNILTGDKDDLQLASSNTKIHLTLTRMGQTTTTVYDSDGVKEAYGVSPLEFIDVKALMGDTSDNVPGVKGIGEKTAFEYIKKFKSIENLYENIDDEIIKKAARQKLIDGKNMAKLSKTLCTIDRNVELEEKIEDFKKKSYNTERLTELFINLEFNAFLKELTHEKNETEEIKKEFKILKSEDELKDKLKNIKEKFIYRLFEDGEKEAVCFAFDEEVCFIKGKVFEHIAPVFKDEKILKISQDIKSDMLMMKKRGYEFEKDYFDLSIAAYLINPSKSSYDIASVSLDILSYPLKEDKDVFKSGREKLTIFELDEEKLKEYLLAQMCVMEKLKETEEEKIKELGMEKLLYEIEFPLIGVLADMEIEGVKVDKKRLEDFTQDLKIKIDEYEKEIYELAGEEFNINSTKQLGVILFEKLGLKVIKKTKTGYSTDAAVLDKLMGSHPIIEKILDYRRASKLKSTYGDGLTAVINPETGRIHSSFNQTVTVTGRISSTEPNLQNIPMRREEGRKIREMFIARSDEYILTDADYSQIELRILAHISDDEAMQEAFRNGEDIHKSTAARVFNVDKNDVTDLLRTRAKAVNFGIVYGMGDFSLSQDLHIPVREAKSYIESYFEKYTGVKNYLDSTVEKAKKDGYVTTMFARRRYLPEIMSSNFIQRSFGERAAMNTPIQGTAADIIKIAMVKVHSELKKRNLKSKLILQVHDELIIETLKQEAEEVKKLLVDCMIGAADLKVPLVSDVGVGENWLEAH